MPSVFEVPTSKAAFVSKKTVHDRYSYNIRFDYMQNAAKK